MADLIDRDAVLAEIGEFQIRFNETGDSHERVAYASAEHCMLVIKAAPAVNRWIAVEDALPENRCGVIFTVDRGHPFVCVGYRINTEREGLKLQRWFDKLSGLNFSDYDVKAWMPMPDAYEPPEKE